MAEVDFRPPGKVFAVATDCWSEDDNRDAVFAKYESSGLDWPLICDSLEEGLADDLSEIPTFAVIDSRGRLRYWEEGEFRERELQAVVDTLTGRRVER